MRDRSGAAGWTALALGLPVLAVGVRSADADDPRAPAPGEPRDAPVMGPAPAPGSPPPNEAPAPAPCGPPAPAGGNVLVVCSTLRIEPSQGGALYHEHVVRRARSGAVFGASVMTTFTPRMRRDGLELLLGSVTDRRREGRILVRPLRGVLDGGEVDHGLELGLALGVLRGRFHVGLEGNAIFGIAFESEKVALGVAAVGQYELLATDTLALVATARLGADFFEHDSPGGAMESPGDPLFSIALGVTYFQVVP